MEKRCARRLVRANVLLTAGRVLLALRGLREGVACVEQALDEYQQALDEVLARIEPSTDSAGIGPADPSAGPRDLERAGPSAGASDLERKCADPSAGASDLERAEDSVRSSSKCAEDPNRRFRRRVEEALSEEELAHAGQLPRAHRRHGGDVPQPGIPRRARIGRRVARSLRPLARMGRGQYGVSLPLRNINGF